MISVDPDNHSEFAKQVLAQPSVLGMKMNEKTKTWTILVCVFLFSWRSAGQGYKPASGYVPDSKTAVMIAEAVLAPVYGEKQIKSERPFTAKLKDGMWTSLVRSAVQTIREALQHLVLGA